ncbi:MAG: RDD family protein [Bacilli bacterium]|nr:RDD family protein [Erysipelotrichaceae bacterium]MDD6250164.1 RDD family protein [Bacillales bacterium]MDY2745747.1 RDD family protein [Bacilli bacterium]MDD7382120.1 RDD family protein [Bacillales bacterium]MDY3890080.1 RDD family protein [Bacilli bacterium]
MNIPRFDKRIISYLIDLIIPSILSLLTYFLLKHSFQILDYLTFFLWVEFFAMVYFLLINSLFAYLFNGNTIGNLFTKTKMVSIDGKRLTLKQVLLKYLPLSLWPTVIINAFYMLYVHTESTIYDTLSNSIVIIK